MLALAVGAAAGLLDSAPSPIATLSRAGQSAPAPILREAEIKSRESTDGLLVLTVHYLYGTPSEDRLVLTGLEIPPSYGRDVVRPSWSRPCAGTVGRRVRVARYRGALLAVLEATSDASHRGAMEYRPCFVRTYFDLTSRHDPSNLLLEEIGPSLRFLSEMESPHFVWVRARAFDLLRDYENPSRIVSAASKLGQPELAASAEPLATLRKQAGDRTLLGKLLPFRYQSPREMPVGTGWPYFVISVYSEDSHGRLIAVQDYTALVRKAGDDNR